MWTHKEKERARRLILRSCSSQVCAGLPGNLKLSRWTIGESDESSTVQLLKATHRDRTVTYI